MASKPRGLADAKVAARRNSNLKSLKFRNTKKKAILKSFEIWCRTSSYHI